MRIQTAKDTKKNVDEHEKMKSDYLEYCFKYVEKNLINDETVDGETFLNSL
jgi:hypothetical protein